MARALRDLYGDTTAATFDPPRLKAVPLTLTTLVRLKRLTTLDF
jgi:hypothetical protein